MVGTAIGLVASSPMRAAPAYGVDSFSEYSQFAVSRTTTTASNPVVQSTQLPRASTRNEDEELFRDLFANEHDWETQEDRSLALGQTKMASQHPTCFKSGKVASTVDTKNYQPTLSAPVPRLNLAELMTARPDAFNPSDTSWHLGKLGSVSESCESDDEDAGAGGKESGPETQSHKLRIPPIPPLNGKKAAVLQQETLSFLERLDLKTLLNTPRPDVLNFYPPNTNAISVAAVPIASARIEENLHSARSANNISYINNKQSSDHYSSRVPHEPLSVDPALARLAFIETTYGTSRAEPRKARKETFDRLANPIAGYSATLLALSPEQRRKRETLDTSETDGLKTRPSLAAMRPKAPKTSSLLEHLGRSASIYEAVAIASSLAARKLHKPEKPKVQRLSDNQLDDSREAHGKATWGKKTGEANRKAGSTTRKLSIRHQSMSQPVASARQLPASNLMSETDRNNCTTFLTQPEEPEVVPCRPTAPPKISKAVATALPSTHPRPMRRPSSSTANQQTKTTLLPSVQLKARRRAVESRETATRNRADSIRGRINRIESSTSTIRPRAPSRPPGGSHRIPPSSRPTRPSALPTGSQPPPSRAKTPDAVSAQRRANAQSRTPKHKSIVSSSAMLLMGTAATNSAPSRTSARSQSSRQLQAPAPATSSHAAKRNSRSSTPYKPPIRS